MDPKLSEARAEAIRAAHGGLITTGYSPEQARMWLLRLGISLADLDAAIPATVDPRSGTVTHDER